jgi:ribosomal protein L12E/L44/L45/RPP1/RPP2
MKGKINKNDVKNISDHYGIDVESELTSMLSEELSKSIDAEIMKNLFSDFKKDKINKILEKINKFNENG